MTLRRMHECPWGLVLLAAALVSVQGRQLHNEIFDRAASMVIVMTMMMVTPLMMNADDNGNNDASPTWDVVQSRILLNILSLTTHQPS